MKKMEYTKINQSTVNEIVTKSDFSHKLQTIREDKNQSFEIIGHFDLVIKINLFS